MSSATVHSWPTRLLHFLLAGATVHQLAVSLVMKVPKANKPGNVAFELHEAVGIASLGIVALFWLWSMVRRNEPGIGVLFPWLSQIRRRALFQDLRTHWTSLRRLRIHFAPERPAASAVHGLGLLAATGMVTTGAGGWLLLLSSGTAQWLLDFHGVLGNVMWVYLIGHATVALLHELVGTRLLRSMFALKS